jgi:cytochrome c peroxidase
MLLSKAVIRISMAIPADADFTLDSVDDPYHCTGPNDIAMFRRPLPSANLKFLSAVMWDGRESAVPNRDITGDLGSQAIDATTGHAQATQPPTPEQVQQIVAFEQAISVAQLWDHRAGDLDANGAHGGGFLLAQQPFYIGINDVLGADPNGKPFDSRAITVYSAWENQNSHRGNASARAARASVARGEVLFNTLPIAITGVKGLNDKLNLPVLNGTCTTCHDAPNAGDHSVKLPIDIGVADAARRTPDMPLYTFRSTATGATVQTTDPGRAMISGKFDDIGKFKGPILRALAARPPYFHNGMAKDLDAAVDFYDTRFQLHLSTQQKTDLAAFLRSL